jgi:NAD(P)-dependent dehydrogenase (short-subunit alcohol dehydrogenase family)
MPETRTASIEAFSLRGEVALITGGGTGLGYAMSAALLAAGAKIVITGRRADVLRNAVESLGPGAHAYPHDITDRDGIGPLIDCISREVGPTSILINNAGTHLKKPLGDTTDADFERVMATHVEGAFAMSRAVAARMKQRGHGSILFIASMTSMIGMPNVVAYSAAKASILGMVRALATELGPEGIRVNAIAPGWIETPMLREALDGDPARSAKILARTPQGRFGRPEDIGWAAVYLCSSAAQFINGVLLPVDGGASIGF